MLDAQPPSTATDAAATATNFNILEFIV